MLELIKLRVFVDEAGGHGNPVGIVVDQDARLSTDARIEMTRDTGFSECIVIEDLKTRSVRTYTGQQEIAFAGHAALGAAWCCAELLGSIGSTLQGPDGRIDVVSAGDLTWVGTELRTTPPWWHERLPTAEAIERLSGPQAASQIHTQLWAWIDEATGRVRSRTFAAEWGIPEDEANGSGCMRLAAALARELEIIHGAGSVIFARLSAPGVAEVGGRVVHDETVSLPIS